MEGRDREEEGRGTGVGAIIVAAGQSARMGGADKLFVPLAGRPLLAHTLDAFQRCPAVERVILVLSADNLQHGRDLVSEHAFDKVAAVCQGGPRRQDSVRLGLEALGPCGWIVVHDGARPLVTSDLIERGLEAARESGAAIAAFPIADTIKEADPASLIVRTMDRDRLWAAQTPQVFRYDLLERAHQEVSAEVSDDAAMLEARGLPVKLYPGSPVNIKVTTPDDLRLAEALLEIEARNSKLAAHHEVEFRVSSFESRPPPATPDP